MDVLEKGPMSNTFAPEQMISEAVAFRVKKWALQTSIPRENLRVDAVHDYMADAMLCRIEVSLRGTLVDGSRKDERVGSVPASLADWLKFYLKKYLGRFGGRDGGVQALGI